VFNFALHPNTRTPDYLKMTSGWIISDPCFLHAFSRTWSLPRGTANTICSSRQSVPSNAAIFTVLSYHCRRLSKNSGRLWYLVVWLRWSHLERKHAYSRGSWSFTIPEV